MKKKQETKELKGDISRLTQREKIANELADYWEEQYKDLESLELGFVKVRATDYEMLLNASLNTAGKRLRSNATK
jgi:predicted neutral ceramidase superfamily lipid hydrolase